MVGSRISGEKTYKRMRAEAGAYVLVEVDNTSDL